MTKTKHTPGPWVTGSWSVGVEGDFADHHNYCEIAEIRQHSLIGSDEATANAHLIAAAPDLYEALERLCNACAGWDVDDLIKDGRAALAKARGET